MAVARAPRRWATIRRRPGVCRRSATAPARRASSPTVTSSAAVAAARRAAADEPFLQEGAVGRGAPDVAHRSHERLELAHHGPHLVAHVDDLPRDGRPHHRRARRAQARARVRVGVDGRPQARRVRPDAHLPRPRGQGQGAMSADETSKDDVTPEEIEARASEEPAASQPAAKKPRSRKKAEATEEAAEPTAVEAEATAEAAESQPAAKKPRSRKKAEASEEAAEPKAVEGGAAEEAAQSQPKPPRRKRDAAPPAKPAPARRGRGRGGRAAEPAVLVRAQAKYVRTSARKARLVCDHIRGKDVAEARAILAFTPRQAAKAWSKLLESAVANAENNHELVGEELRIHSVVADEGPTLNRFRPRAMGRATRIRKRTSHLTITLTPKES